MDPLGSLGIITDAVLSGVMMDARDCMLVRRSIMLESCDAADCIWASNARNCG